MPSSRIVYLTVLESLIIKLIANGAASKEIACIIDRSFPTVQEHIQRAFAKLNARSRPHLVSTAWCCGVLRRSDIEGVNVEVIVASAPTASRR
jgi:DNA-binding CsgD family transcriptional regulator